MSQGESCCKEYESENTKKYSVISKDPDLNLADRQTQGCIKIPKGTLGTQSQSMYMFVGMGVCVNVVGKRTHRQPFFLKLHLVS